MGVLSTGPVLSHLIIAQDESCTGPASCAVALFMTQREFWDVLELQTMRSYRILRPQKKT